MGEEHCLTGGYKLPNSCYALYVKNDLEREGKYSWMEVATYTEATQVASTIEKRMAQKREKERRMRDTFCSEQKKPCALRGEEEKQKLSSIYTAANADTKRK